VPPPPSKPALAPLLPETHAQLDHPTGHFRPPGWPSATPQADAPFAHRECFAQPGLLLDPPSRSPRSPAPVPVPGSRYAVPGTGGRSQTPGTGSRYQASSASTVCSPLPSRGSRPYNDSVNGSGSREVELAKAGRSLGAAPVDVSYLSAALAAEPGADRVPGHLPRVPRRVPGDAVRRLLELRRQLPRPQGP